jgi:hypothetical protein
LEKFIRKRVATDSRISTTMEYACVFPIMESTERARKTDGGCPGRAAVIFEATFACGPFEWQFVTVPQGQNVPETLFWRTYCGQEEEENRQEEEEGRQEEGHQEEEEGQAEEEERLSIRHSERGVPRTGER